MQLEEGFRSVVNSDAYHVFITEYEDNNALYVAERTSTGFSGSCQGVGSKRHVQLSGRR